MVAFIVTGVGTPSSMSALGGVGGSDAVQIGNRAIAISDLNDRLKIELSQRRQQQPVLRLQPQQEVQLHNQQQVLLTKQDQQVLLQRSHCKVRLKWLQTRQRQLQQGKIHQQLARQCMLKLKLILTS
jgi:hypothetical protein